MQFPIAHLVDQPTARVYLGSYNFSKAADSSNGENLLLIQDHRIAVSYLIEAIRLSDHYYFRVNQLAAAGTKKKLSLATPPKAGEAPWWQEYFTAGTVKSRDRLLFAWGNLSGFRNPKGLRTTSFRPI